MESSESILSPNGVFGVSVSSQTFDSDKGLSQAVVSSLGQGSGLIAFYLPRVSMGFVWNSDYELVIRYPNDLPPPRIDATNNSFGRGGRGRILYEAVPRDQIRPLQWTQVGELRVMAEEPLERGILVTLKTDDGVAYSYSYYDIYESDSSRYVLEARGLQAGGYSWAGIIYGLVSIQAPEIIDVLDLDPEGDGLVIRSTSRKALITVSRLVAAAKHDPKFLDEAIKRAERDAQME